jgi:hypothetical protein
MAEGGRTVCLNVRRCCFPGTVREGIAQADRGEFTNSRASAG